MLTMDAQAARRTSARKKTKTRRKPQRRRLRQAGSAGLEGLCEERGLRIKKCDTPFFFCQSMVDPVGWVEYGTNFLSIVAKYASQDIYIHYWICYVTIMPSCNTHLIKHPLSPSYSTYQDHPANTLQIQATMHL